LRTLGERLKSEQQYFTQKGGQGARSLPIPAVRPNNDHSGKAIVGKHRQKDFQEITWKFSISIIISVR
jgi:hypothetical protein